MSIDLNFLILLLEYTYCVLLHGKSVIPKSVSLPERSGSLILDQQNATIKISKTRMLQVCSGSLKEVWSAVDCS